MSLNLPTVNYPLKPEDSLPKCLGLMYFWIFDNFRVYTHNEMSWRWDPYLTRKFNFMYHIHSTITQSEGNFIQYLLFWMCSITQGQESTFPLVVSCWHFLFLVWDVEPEMVLRWWNDVIHDCLLEQYLTQKYSFLPDWQRWNNTWEWGVHPLYLRKSRPKI